MSPIKSHYDYTQVHLGLVFLQHTPFSPTYLQDTPQVQLPRRAQSYQGYGKCLAVSYTVL